MTTQQKPQRWPETFRTRVSRETLAEARRVAADRETTLSALARVALVAYLREQRDG